MSEETDEFEVTLPTHLDLEPKGALGLKDSQLPAFLIGIFILKQLENFLPKNRELTIATFLVTVALIVLAIINISGRPGWKWLKIYIHFWLTPRNYAWRPAARKAMAVMGRRTFVSVKAAESTI